MSRRFLGCGFAVAVALSSTALAQNPTTQPPPAQQQPPMTRPAEPAKAAGATGTPVTIEGCVVREVDAPGRTPPPEMQSRANTDDDYILTETKVITGATSGAAAATNPSADRPTGTSGMAGSALMYEIDELDKGQLKEHIGKL